MSQYVPNENRLVTCPYDNAHRMKESRLQLHIAKCKLNHLDREVKVCPFHATHLVSPAEYNHHLITCEYRAPLDRQLAQTINKNDPYKGRTDVPQYSDPIQVDEVWEVDTERVALPPPPAGAVREPGEFAKPAERKRFYLELHQLPKTEETIPKLATVVSPKAPEPAPVSFRQPAHKSAVETAKKADPQVIQSLGLGRGRPSASRIAANFPKTESAAVNPNQMFSSVVQGMANLGLGRGMSNQNTGPAPNFDDDFPALGCGRGIVHKQNVRHPGVKPKN